MDSNIAKEYISFSEKCIKKYLKMILERYFDQDIYDDMINAYINVRYYNLYPPVEKRFEKNIVYYLKKSLENVKDDSKYRAKAKIMFQMFRYILYFDNVLECDSVRVLISQIQEYRKKQLKIFHEDFEVQLYDQLQEDLTAKAKFLQSYKDKNFTLDFRKVKNGIFYCVLEHNIQFSKLYSDYAISKVFNNKEIGEQKLFVTYSLAGLKAMQDIIKGNFKKIYLVDYEIALADKPKKNKRLLNLIDNDVLKEKIILKISFNDYLSHKEHIYGLTRSGYKVAATIGKDFCFSTENETLLNIFKYVIIDDGDLYNSIIDINDFLYIPSK